MGKETYRCEYVKCGKRGCRKCPHGPYWYGYWREEGKVRKRYVGKVDPHTRAEGKSDTQSEAPPVTQERDWREAILNSRTATRELARRIIGVSAGATREEVRKVYQRRMLDAHPDRGGDKREAAFLNAAWSYLKWVHSW